MKQSILKTIRHYNMIAPGDRVAVACSAGADSTALLLLLRELEDELGCLLLVAHFNHCWRGEESDADEAFVRSLALRLERPFLAGRAHEPPGPHSAGLEEKARRMRYRFFRELLSSGHADRVALAHTADDQAETVLHRLLRGAGPAGLAGIHPVVQSTIIRPLLEVRRLALRQWLTARQQPWREDSSNLDLRFVRNRLRLEVLPQLARFNPRLTERLAHTAAIAWEEEGFWREYLRPLLEEAAQVRPGEVRLRRDALRRAPRTVARRLLRWALAAAAQLPGTAGSAAVWDQPPAAGFVQTEQLLDWACEPAGGGRFCLPGGVAAEREFEHLIVVGHQKGQVASPYCYAVAVPARVAVPEIGTVFDFQLIRLAEAEACYNGAEDRILLDLKVSRAALTLRNWQPGDSLRPRGRRKERKLKELFQRLRVARGERACWPVLVAADRVIWARGWPVSEDFLPAAGSAEVLQMQVAPWEGAEQ